MDELVYSLVEILFYKDEVKKKLMTTFYGCIHSI